MKAVACRTLALPHLQPPGERVEMPYQGRWLAGILRKPVGVDRPPVVVMAMGLDSAKEEADCYEQHFLARRMATLSFDGPGQGEAEYDFAIRGDYEVAVAAVIDFIQTRRDLDCARIGLWGVSLGGYYYARAPAAFERGRAPAWRSAGRSVERPRGTARSSPARPFGCAATAPAQKRRAATPPPCRSRASPNILPARSTS